MATLFQADIPSQHIEHLLSALQPKSIADVAAIAIFSAIALAYGLRGKAWDRKDPYHHIWFERPQKEGAVLGSTAKATRNIAQKLEEDGKDCVIFWGSQSGTAEGFAARLARECQLRFSLQTMTADLSDYDSETIALIPETKLAVFILSTYGEGDPSDNTAVFWEWIMKAESSLPKLRFAAFGLGNSNYKHYNRVVDVVVPKLELAGAHKMLDTGKADDAKGSTEEDFVSWKDDLFRTFRQELHLEEKAVEYQPTMTIVEDESMAAIDLYDGEPVHDRGNPRALAQSSAIKSLPIKRSQELFTAGPRNCIHMELDLSDELVYKTGDHLAIWPSNPDEEVERLLTTLGRQAQKDTPLLIKALDSSRLKVPSPTSLSALFHSYLDVCAPVSRETVLSLADFAPDTASRDYLTQLGKDRDAFAELVSHTHLTFGRLLAHAAPDQIWSNLPISFVIESIPALQPRYYSISSSSVCSPRRVAVTALVSADDLPVAHASITPPTKVHGVTTNYLLAHHHASDPVPTTESGLIKYSLPTASTPAIYAHIRKSKFKLPLSKSTPLILVAAGTGIAPFRAFIAERAKQARTSTTPVGEIVLFYGCRSPDEDYIYRQELETVQQEGKVKLDIKMAFSRMHGQRKVYVQDRIEEENERVLRLLDQEGASLFVCGRTGMAKEVARRVASMKVEGGDEWVDGLKRRGKWREDVWG